MNLSFQPLLCSKVAKIIVLKIISSDGRLPICVGSKKLLFALKVFSF